MKDFAPWLLALVLMAVFCLLIFAYVYDNITPDDYTYTDLAGNNGTADLCSDSKGILTCYKRGKRITVREYMMIKEEE